MTTAVILAALAGCAGGPSLPAVAAPSPGAVRLPPKTTAFVRFYGSGRLPTVTAPIVYELCVDLHSGALVSVRSPDNDQQSDAQLANVLRGWKWSIAASLPLTSGTKCWLERFAPQPDKPDAAIEPATGLRQLLLAGDTEDLFDVPQAGPAEDTLAAIEVLEQARLRIVFLEPRLTTLPSEELPPRDASHVLDAKALEHPQPHLPGRYLVHHRGSSMTAVYKVCVDRDGRVSEVRPEMPILGAHGSIVPVLKTWRFTPLPMPVCSMLTFAYSIS